MNTNKTKTENAIIMEDLKKLATEEFTMDDIDEYIKIMNLKQKDIYEAIIHLLKDKIKKDKIKNNYYIEFYKNHTIRIKK